MMATTHVLVGLALVAPAAYTVPEVALPLAAGAILGGLAPDLDVCFDHRRTLHFPFVGAVVAIPLVSLAVAAPGPWTAGLGAFAVTAWLHAASDALGAGPEIDPWRNPTDRAVYDHLRGRWIRPRRWVRYDGAPEDAALGLVLAIPPLLVFDGWLVTAIMGGLGVSIGYAIFRRRVVEWTPGWLE